MLKVNPVLASSHAGLGGSSCRSSRVHLCDQDGSDASLKTFCAPGKSRLASITEILDRMEVLRRLNGNYTTVSRSSRQTSLLNREAQRDVVEPWKELSTCPRSKPHKTSQPVSELERIHSHTSDIPTDSQNSFLLIDQACERLKLQGCRRSHLAPWSRLKHNVGACSKVPSAASHYHFRRQQRNRKFRLNLFMYGGLYRKQKKVEHNYVIYHNPLEDPDATYTSYSNPNYFFNRAHHHLHNNNTINNNDSSLVNGNTTSISLEKLSLTSDFFSPRKGSFSSYSSCEPTPTTPDRTFILQKLHSPSDDDDDDDDDDIEADALSLGEEEADAKEPADSQTDAGSTKEEPRIFYGVGSQQCRRSRGILGYLEMLEKQAMEREMRGLCGGTVGEDNQDDHFDRDDDDGGDESPKTMQGGDQPVEPPRDDKFDLGTEINSPDSNDSGFQTGEKTPILFSPEIPGHLVPEPAEEAEASPSKEVLPEGWQKHEDDDGPYYWHVKSGTIQRDPPPPAPPDGPILCSPKAISMATESSCSAPSTPNSISSGTERHLVEFEGHALQYAAKSLQSVPLYMDKMPAASQKPGSEKVVRFPVRSLGWAKIDEDDLTPERSSKAVNKCIVDLSQGRNNVNDAVGRWGDGKDLFMDLDHTSLRLVDPVDGLTLNSQPIHSIRVWGVGRDNARDFAYVARDRGTRTHMCHVFHCEAPAREIANTLKDICKKIVLERSLHQSAVARLTRPTDLPNLDKMGQPKGEKLSFQNLYNNARFPTPMEEPRKVMKCHYLGCHEVTRPTGRDTLNEAIQHKYYTVPPEKWKFVNIAIAPSTITITEIGNPDGVIEECRVRFLSFMGIAADNVKLCAFIMHTSQNKFICHVFHSEPSAGPMCKTIEAACKLRYQKCLDAHPQTPKGGLPGKSVKQVFSAGVQTGVQGLKEVKSSAVQSMMGMLSLFKGGTHSQADDT